MPQARGPDDSVIVQEAVDGGSRLVAISPSHSPATRVLAESKAFLTCAAVSPDGSWLAFQSNESGEFEVYVRPYRSGDDRQWRVSTDGGTEPVWSATGRELFYRTVDGTVMSVPVQTQNGFVAGPATSVVARPYYKGNGLLRQYDVSGDGQRFLMLKDTGGRIVVVENWLDQLARRVPAQ